MLVHASVALASLPEVGRVCSGAVPARRWGEVTSNGFWRAGFCRLPFLADLQFYSTWKALWKWERILNRVRIIQIGVFCFLDRISFCIVDLRARGVEIPVLFAEVRYQLLLLLGSLSLVDACVWEKCMQTLEQVGSAYSSAVKDTRICTDGSKLGWSGCLERRPGSSQHSSLPSWG